MPLLKTSDEKCFRVPFALARHSALLRHVIEDAGLTEAEESSLPVLTDGEELIPIPNITGPIMTKVIEWLEFHKD